MTYALRRDANHSQLVADLEACGFSVLEIDKVGGGAPDILVGGMGRNGPQMLLIEVKNPATAYGKALAPSQRRWATWWRGPPVIVARSAEDVLRAFDAVPQQVVGLSVHGSLSDGKA